jgi:hypothetical protein
MNQVDQLIKLKHYEFPLSEDPDGVIAEMD